MLPRKYNKVCSSATRTWANRSNSLELTEPRHDYLGGKALQNQTCPDVYPTAQRQGRGAVTIMVSDDIRRRSRSGREQQCLICDSRVGREQHGAQFVSLHHATEQIDFAVWEAMVEADQQLSCLGSLPVLEEAGDLYAENVKPWTLIVHVLVCA